MSYLLGIDLGGSSIKAVAVTPHGGLQAKFNESFDPDKRLQFAEKIRALIGRAETELGEPAEQIGLSAPGLVSKDGGSIAFMPGRLDGLVGLDWSKYLGIGQSVPVLNDAHAALLGEAWLGAARGCRNAIMLTLGTGVGGAAMVDGRLLRGHSGKAGHLGHVSLDMDGPADVCDMPGSLEFQVGNYSIEQRSAGQFDSTHELLEALREGDLKARQIWDRSLRALAVAIGGFTNVLDPEVVIIGGGIARAGDALFAPLKELVPQFEWQVCADEVQIRPAELGEFAGAYGAAFNAINCDKPQR